MDIHERLRQSEQSRRLAWQVLQEIRHVLEILGDQQAILLFPLGKRDVARLWHKTSSVGVATGFAT
jgi:hypothetical protein